MRTVVCFGDSNTHGYDGSTGERFPPDVRWPGVLAAELGPAVKVIEEGLNGRTTLWEDPYYDGRNGGAYLLPCLRSHAPVDALVIMLGTNDTKSVFRRTAAEIASGAGALVDMALGSRTGPGDSAPRVLLVAPPALGEPTDRSDLWGFGEARAKASQFPRLYRVAAELLGVAFLDASAVVEVDPADGVHLDAASHARLGQSIAAAVEDLLR